MTTLVRLRRYESLVCLVMAGGVRSLAGGVRSLADGTGFLADEIGSVRGMMADIDGSQFKSFNHMLNTGRRHKIFYSSIC